MPTKTYKEARVCECGYTTVTISNWSIHKKRCKLVKCDKDELIEQMKQQLASKDEQMKQQLAAKDEQLAAKDQQLAAKDEQLAAKDRQIEQLIKTNPPNRPRTTKRKGMTEPQRRKIALRQNFKCANPDGECKLIDGNLKEYDVDHVDPLFLGGPDDESNMQALCPACHRRKTERDALQARQVGLTEKL